MSIQPILKLARYFEIKLAQHANTDAEMARYILSLYHSFGLVEGGNALSYMDEQAFKIRTLNLLIYQTAHQEANWINQFTNYLTTNIERVHPGLKKNIRIYYVKRIQRPNLPLIYKTLEVLARKPMQPGQPDEQMIQDLEQLGISEDQIQSLTDDQIQSLIEENITGGINL